MGIGEEHGMTDNPSRGTMMVCPNCDATFLANTEVCPKDGAGLIEVPDAGLLTGSELDGRYQIGSVIGSGAMGTVYRAYQRSMDRNVAVKVLHPKYAHDPRAVKRFFREAQSASRLIHPNIVTVFDFGRSRQSHLYMVMELVEGWTLGDLIYYRAPLDVGLAASIALQICEALSHAHEHHTVHRDLKPDNVQLTKVGDKVWAKVLDFGIARMTRESQSGGGIQANQSTIEIAGTPAYMSPEQILGKAPDTRTDLYSLGIILFEMLTASRPFEDENSVTLCMKQLNDIPPTIESVVGEGKVPPSLARLIESLLEKDMTLRPDRAESMADILRPLAGEDAVRELAEQLQSEVPAGLAHAPTRQDGGATLAEVAAAQESSEQAPAGSLSAVLERVKLNMPSPFAKPDVRPCPTCATVVASGEQGCPKCGHVESVQAEEEARGRSPKRLVSRRGKHVASVCLISEKPLELENDILRDWMESLRDEGHDIRAKPLALTVDYMSKKQFGADEVESVIRNLVALASRLRTARVGMRIGFCTPADGSSAEVAERAKRLAGVAPLGAVVIPASMQGAVKVRTRPLTDTYLSTGQPLQCAVVTERAVRRSQASEILLYGRTAALRRLGQIYGDGSKKGVRQVFVSGERGVGKSALVREFVASLTHVHVRVGALGRAWPGYTIARLAVALLGGGTARAPEAVASLYHDANRRTRRLLDVLFMRDNQPAGDASTWIAASEIAACVYDMLRKRAGDERLVIVLDDIHLLDPASKLLLDEIMRQGRHEDWLFVGCGPSNATLRRDLGTEWQELPLRPLGLRAATQFLEALGAPRSRLSMLAEVSGGNPLAIQLLARLGEDAPLRPGAIVERLLPETLQGLAPQVAEQAWTTAVYGDDEKSDLEVRAARMYLEAAANPRIHEWLSSRIRVHGGVYSATTCGWRALTREHLLARAKRYESLGLFELAEPAFLNASRYHLKTQGVWERLEAARMRARLGDGDGATALYREAIEIGLTVAHTAGLVALGESLLVVDQDRAALEVLEKAQAGIVRTQATRFETGRLWTLLARCAMRQSNRQKALDYLHTAQELVNELRTDDARGARLLEARLQEVRAEVAISDGDADAARLNLRQASDAFRDLELVASATRTLLLLGQVELDTDENGRALDTYKACVALAGSQGLVAELGIAKVGCGTAMLRTGSADEGVQLLRTVLRERGGGRGEATLALGHAMIYRGLKADAARYGDQAYKLAANDGQRGRALLLLSQAQDGLTQALRYMEEARTLLRRSGNAILLGRVARDNGDSFESRTSVHGSGFMGNPDLHV